MTYKKVEYPGVVKNKNNQFIIEPDINRITKSIFWDICTYYNDCSICSLADEKCKCIVKRPEDLPSDERR